MFVKDILIIIGSFVLHFISFGMIKSFGVIYTALIEYFDSTRADTGWIASLGAGIALLFGPVAGILEERFGCQLVAFLGSICIGIGMATSSFVTNIHLFYLTYGTITEIGFSLCHLASSVAVNRHFEKRRVTAVALSNTGSGIGTMVLPILGSFLTDRYGWPGTFLIFSGVGLQGAYCGIMIKTLGPSSIRSAQDIRKKTDQGETILKKTKAILSTRKYTIYTMSVFFVGMAYFVPFTILPNMVVTLGISDDNAALMITVAGVASLYLLSYSLVDVEMRRGFPTTLGCYTQSKTLKLPLQKHRADTHRKRRKSHKEHQIT